MKIDLSLNKRGITLIELLIAFVILAITVAAIYRIFITQTRAYTAQDQVVDVQQTIRSAMEIMVRDLRMAQFHYNSSTSNLLNPANAANILDNPLRMTPSPNSLTVEYEYYNAGPPVDSHRYRVDYALNGTELRRTLTIDGGAGAFEVLLGNVEALSFTCGTDGMLEEYSSQDGVVDAWVPCGNVPAGSKVIAIRVILTARPEQELVNPDLATLSPRTLTSTVVLRNPAQRKM
jgi:prepilin-type N-terminal cleavage/methylation domain-containing protein